MRRRRLLVGVGAVALLGVAGFASYLWLTSLAPGVTWASFRRLRLLMSSRDVEGVLGKPHETFETPAYTNKCWRGHEVVISATFVHDRLHSARAVPPDPQNPDTVHREYAPPDESFLDRIRRWLHL